MTVEGFSLLALSLVPGLGIRGSQTLIKKFGSAKRVLRLTRTELRGFGLSREAELGIVTGYAQEQAQKALEKARRQEILILDQQDNRYPALLAEICDPPLVLYAIGNCELLSSDCIAIVGARRCTPYGGQITRKLASELAGFGLTVVSGMARGIDSMAHRGALEVNGSTIAVLGNGVDVIYPRENKRLYTEIGEAGCIISEFPLESHPAPQNFPIRNRIISGLSWGTLVPEAAEFSGSLVTARLTLEQNRELLAVPGNVTSEKSFGPNYLIKQGAAPVIVSQDVLDELPLPVLNRLRSRADEESSRNPLDSVTCREKEVLQFLKVETSTHFDLLLEKTGWDIADLSSTLLTLEIKKLIQAQPGRKYNLRLL